MTMVVSVWRRLWSVVWLPTLPRPMLLVRPLVPVWLLVLGQVLVLVQLLMIRLLALAARGWLGCPWPRRGLWGRGGWRPLLPGRGPRCSSLARPWSATLGSMGP